MVVYHQLDNSVSIQDAAGSSPLDHGVETTRASAAKTGKDPFAQRWSSCVPDLAGRVQS